MWRLLLVFAPLIFSACNFKSSGPSYPKYQYAPELEVEGVALRYDKWSVTQNEFFEHLPEFRAFHEEFSAVQTAVALKSIMKDLQPDERIVITGCSREAGIMSLRRFVQDFDDKKLSFKDAQGKNTITAAGKTYDVAQLRLDNIELARLQTQYYLKGQIAAEDMLIKKILTTEEKKTLGEGLRVSQEAFKSYLKRKRIDPKAIGLRGVQKVKDGLMKQQLNDVYRDYVERYIYKGPVLSRWKKPEYQVGDLQLKSFTHGRGKFKLVVFAPYDCKACLNWNQDLPQLLFHEIDLTYYPASSDNNRLSSQMFYEAAFCLREQQEDAPWKMFVEFKNIYSRTTFKDKLYGFIKTEKLSTAKYEQCVSKNTYTLGLEHLMRYSQNLNAKAYPVVVAGGFVFMGEVTMDDIKQALYFNDSRLAARWDKWAHATYEKSEKTK